MTKEQIEQEIESILLDKTENLKVLSSIREQIEHAKAQVITAGVYADPHWYASANGAMRRAGRRDQEFATKLSGLRKRLNNVKEEQKRIQSLIFDTAFVDVAKQKLTGEMFSALRDAALAHIQQTSH